MADLKDFQFELDGYRFGLGLPMLITDGGFDTGSATWRTQDTDLAQRDGKTYGRDLLTGPTWAFELGTDQHSTEEALRVLSDFTRVWRADDVRSKPGAVLPLRYRVAGRTRRVYGRPRRLAAPPSNRILDGWLPVTADFDCADALHYDDEEGSASVGIEAAPSGGISTPLVAPLSTVQISRTTQGQFLTGGDADTWVIVEFTGPVINPSVDLDGLHIGLRGTVKQDETVTIDPRPWARTVTRQSGASAAGMVDRFTRMDRMRVRPGWHLVRFSGSSTSSSARATVRWRSASYAL